MTKTTQKLWLYGLHPCQMALANPQRKIHRIIVTTDGIVEKLFKGKLPCSVDRVDKNYLLTQLPRDAVHQGIAMHVSPLPEEDISLLSLQSEQNQCVVVLDQVTDPHNVGAILRSAAVFGAKAIIMPERHAPPETGVLAKAASGALELIPIIRVSNLAQAIKQLQTYGFWSIGFAESGEKPLHQLDLTGKVALIMGSEGDGMRRLTQELCDFTAYLPTSETFSTLNVSNAAAIALYETFKIQRSS